MPFRVATAPIGSPRGAVRLDGSDPEDHDALLRSWVPWVRLPGNEIIVHVSSIVFLLKDGVVSGFADRSAKDLWSAYAAECKATYGTMGRLEPVGSYPWGRHMTREWRPCRYQMAGMERMYARLVLSGGGLLADDVGLGKTPVSIALGERLRAEGRPCPAVVVTTLATLTQWKDEVERFAAARPKIVIADGGRAERKERLRTEADWLLMSYETAQLSQYAKAVDRVTPGVLFLDEAYRVGNPDTLTSMRVAQLASRSRVGTVALNATPIENAITDTFGQLRCIERSVLGSFQSFCERYVKADDTGRVIGARNLREFRQRTAAVFLRRTAAECKAEVPDVVAQVRRCLLSKRQETAYRAAVGKFVSESSTGAVAAAKLAAVRYAAFAADILDPLSDSAKMDDLAAMLRGELSGQRVIVISRFRRVIEFAAARLRQFRPYVIVGATPSRERAEIRRRFCSPMGEGRVLLGTEAIERGLNLQAAGVLYNLDLPWNAARLRQRVGRIARVGQSRRKVLVLNSIAKLGKGRSVDDWILTIVLGKRRLFAEVFGSDDVDEVGREAVDLSAARAFLSGGRV